MMQNYLFTPDKIAYVRGERPDVACILCGVIEKDPKVENLEVFRDELFVVSVNLYPYNPGHIIIFPLRHIEWPGELTPDEVVGLHSLQLKAMEGIGQLYPARGFNIGYNLGAASGGSIPHLHLHVVPRFNNEKGFMATIAATEIIVLNPFQMIDALRETFL